MEAKLGFDTVCEMASHVRCQENYRFAHDSKIEIQNFRFAENGHRPDENKFETKNCERVRADEYIKKERSKKATKHGENTEHEEKREKKADKTSNKRDHIHFDRLQRKSRPDGTNSLRRFFFARWAATIDEPAPRHSQ